jgi:hypothetical protein
MQTTSLLDGTDVDRMSNGLRVDRDIVIDGLTNFDETPLTAEDERQQLVETFRNNPKPIPESYILVWVLGERTKRGASFDQELLRITIRQLAPRYPKQLSIAAS